MPVEERGRLSRGRELRGEDHSKLVDHRVLGLSLFEGIEIFRRVFANTISVTEVSEDQKPSQDTPNSSSYPQSSSNRDRRP